MIRDRYKRVENVPVSKRMRAGSAVFSDGSRERGDVLIGADGIHSAIRKQLFGSEGLRFAGYLAWRGIAKGASPLPERESLVVVGRGSQVIAASGIFIGF
jgi:2-polyprenyl-6-methoxyphenol hydroxylase-like FAD-dependent oxidoreductase